MRLTLIKRRRKTAPKAKKTAKPKRKILRRKPKPKTPAPGASKQPKARKTPHPKPRTVAA